MNERVEEGSMVGDKYKVCEYIAGGAFGEVHIGKNMVTGEPVAIKFELRNNQAPQLPLEYRFFKNLGPHRGLPKIFYFGACGAHHALVMELLGPSLETVFNKCNRKFSLKTTCFLAIQLISLIEYVHNKRIIYRDIKPDNFLLGRKGALDPNYVRIIDLGLAKDYIGEDGKHIPYREGKKNMVGTPRYMSINAHLKRELSRRDDLEAIGYVLMYFLRGSLPWQGLKVDNNAERYRMIEDVKKNTSVDTLCALFPSEFASYLKYVRGLKFEATPDYKHLKDSFYVLAKRNGYNEDNLYDWNDKVDKSDELPKKDGSGFSTVRLGQR